MQVRDEEKRRTILRTARDLFSRRPFHEVRLDDVAAAARVGKGTLYVYFNSKEQLYLELVEEAFDLLLADVAALATDAGRDAWPTLEEAVRRIARWTIRHPTIFDIIRSGVHPAGADRMRQRRRKLGDLLEALIVRGVASGEIDDPQPAITANFIPAMARSGAVHGRGAVRADVLADRILSVLARGIRSRA